MDMTHISLFQALSLAFCLEILFRFPTMRLAWAVVQTLLAHFQVTTEKILYHPTGGDFIQEGLCQRCGDCCEHIVSTPPKILTQGLGLRIYVGFHKLAHNFSVNYRGPNREIVFKCGHLRNDGSCSIYWRRPLLCRRYPLPPDRGQPKVLPNCSYFYTPKVVAKMQSRTSLHILNPTVAMHHPTPITTEKNSLEGQYQPVEICPENLRTAKDLPKP